MSDIPSPYPQFFSWMEDAKSAEPSDPDAACLATVDKDGLPNARVVLIRKIDERGFCFFTNAESQKGEEVLAQKKAAINFHWKSLKRQVRVRGTVEQVAVDEADAYYASRPLGNRIGAWASLQSRPLHTRDELVARVSSFEEKFGSHPPRPPHWGGFRIVPQSIEFWQEGEYRLHDRTRYDIDKNGAWVIGKLYP